MFRNTYSPRYFKGPLVVMGLLLTSITISMAQSRELESPRFVPPSTYAAMSLNRREILKRVDLDDPLIAELVPVLFPAWVAVEPEDLLLPLVDEAAEGSGRTKRRTEVA